jgi:hypothetical protein
MTALRADVFAGRINPGDITIVRSVVTTGALASDVDTAVFRGARAEYTITANPDGSLRVDHNGGIDGVDTLRNIEVLSFTDGPVAAPVVIPVSGSVVISDTTPTENQVLAVQASTLSSPGGVNASTLAFTWQAETATGTGVFTDVGTGTSFVPADAAVGLRLRVVVTFQDVATPPNTLTVASAPTAPVLGVNDAPTGLPTLSDTTPTVGASLSALTGGIADADGLGAFTYQWLVNGAAITGATLVSYVPVAADAGRQLSVRVSYVDLQGFAETLTSAASAAVAATPSGGVVSLTASVDFGRRRINTVRTQQLRVTNTGTAPIVIGSITTSGGPFSATLGTCTAPVAPGGNCRASVTYQPTSAQPHVGTVTVVSDATNSPTVTALTGTGR